MADAKLYGHIICSACGWGQKVTFRKTAYSQDGIALWKINSPDRCSNPKCPDPVIAHIIPAPPE